MIGGRSDWWHLGELQLFNCAILTNWLAVTGSRNTPNRSVHFAKFSEIGKPRVDRQAMSIIIWIECVTEAHLEILVIIGRAVACNNEHGNTCPSDDPCRQLHVDNYSHV